MKNGGGGGVKGRGGRGGMGVVVVQHNKYIINHISITRTTSITSP